jgi:hypothetical protein
MTDKTRAAITVYVRNAIHLGSLELLGDRFENR